MTNCYFCHSPVDRDRAAYNCLEAAQRFFIEPHELRNLMEGRQDVRQTHSAGASDAPV